MEDQLQLEKLEHRAPCCQMECSLQPSGSSPALDSAPILDLALLTLAETPARAVIGRWTIDPGVNVDVNLLPA